MLQPSQLCSRPASLTLHLSFPTTGLNLRKVQIQDQLLTNAIFSTMDSWEMPLQAPCDPFSDEASTPNKDNDVKSEVLSSTPNSFEVESLTTPFPALTLPDNDTDTNTGTDAHGKNEEESLESIATTSVTSKDNGSETSVKNLAASVVASQESSAKTHNSSHGNNSLIPLRRPMPVDPKAKDACLVGFYGGEKVIHIISPIQTMTTAGISFLDQKPDKLVLKDILTKSESEPNRLTTPSESPNAEKKTVGEKPLATNEKKTSDDKSPDNNESEKKLVHDEIPNTNEQNMGHNKTPDKDGEKLGHSMAPNTKEKKLVDKNTSDANKENLADCSHQASPLPTPPPSPNLEGGDQRHRYEEHFEIRPSSRGGLGAFAVKDLKKWDIVLMETPVLRTTHFGFTDDFFALNEEDQKVIRSLHGAKYPGDIQGIKTVNQFYVPEGIAILGIGSRFNHACVPVRNLRYAFDNNRNVMTFTVCKDHVPKGEELLISYGSGPVDLYNTYGFRCRCGACATLTDRDLAQIRKARYM
ncbi:hypothetical protein B0H63DRAFT_505527 [Podospora didyma]|uniref:SET domain-containing protein n=1 Tax=Podospora didyma TaxID=330526 RepID=A0AAE0P5I3_9PEZI|nr:hypothetical protein B0H63DRAFT_505527 [Podospora didyma]